MTVINITKYHQQSFREASFEIEQACMYATLAEQLGNLPADFKLPERDKAVIQSDTWGKK